MTANLPNAWRVIPFDSTPTINAPTVVLYRDTVQPGSTFDLLRNTLTLWVLSPKQIGAADDLDGLLDTVLAVLDQAAGLTWSLAEFMVYADTYPAFKITLEMTTNKEYTS